MGVYVMEPVYFEGSVPPKVSSPFADVCEDVGFERDGEDLGGDLPLRAKVVRDGGDLGDVGDGVLSEVDRTHAEDSVNALEALR